MRSSWSEPYLWVHLAGLAAVPIFLELCLIGLSASQRVLPAGLVFLLVSIAGISPILWMQWYRPFCIFSLVVLALKPSELTEEQRQILQCFKTPVTRAISVAMAIVAFMILVQLNRWVTLDTMIPVPGGWFGGLLLAMVAFLLSHLFLQVPASVLSVLLTPESRLRAALPYPVAKIPMDFSLIGIPVKQILPPMVLAAPVVAPAATPAATPTSIQAAAPEADVLITPIQDEPFQTIDDLESNAPKDDLEPESSALKPEVQFKPDPDESVPSSDLISTELNAAEVDPFILSEIPADRTGLSEGTPPDATVPDAGIPDSTGIPAPNIDIDTPNTPVPDLTDTPITNTSSLISPPDVTDTIVTIRLSSAQPLTIAAQVSPAHEEIESRLPSVADTIVTIKLEMPEARLHK